MNKSVFIPKNELESALIRYCLKEISIEDFYRVFINSKIYVISPEKPPFNSEHHIADKHTRLAYFVQIFENKPYILIFTSPERVQHYLKSKINECTVIGLNSKDFLESLSGKEEGLLLNLGSSYGKEFIPAEIQRLLVRK